MAHRSITARTTTAALLLQVITGRNPSYTRSAERERAC
jgi:hypothetical protein